MVALHSGIFAIQETRANIGPPFPSRLNRTPQPGQYNTRPRSDLVEFEEFLCAKCGNQLFRQIIYSPGMTCINPIVNASAITPAFGMIFPPFLVIQNKAHDRGELVMTFFLFFKPFPCVWQNRKTFEEFHHFIHVKPHQFVNDDHLIFDRHAIIPRFWMARQRGFYALGLFGTIKCGQALTNEQSR